MKIGIYCGVDVGNVRDLTLDYIGVDRGVSHLLKQNITPIIALGDMDSIEYITLLNGLDVDQVSSIKDDTDTALAIKYAIAKGYDEIDLYGVTQRRMDHFLAVLCLLEQYQNYAITIYDQQNKIFVLRPGIHTIPKDGYHYFSLFAFKESFITLKECHYLLNHYHLIRHDPLCVSNQMNNDYAIVENTESVLFIQSQ